MNITTRQLKAFLLTARLGNFTRAAEKMFLTQAGLSVMMRELETQLDARLFDRTTRSVSLTEAGQRLLPAAVRALAEIEEAATQISEISDKARTTLRLAAPPLISATLLPLICQQFHALHPEVTLQLIDCNVKRVQTLVENGEVDMGFGFFFKSTQGVERSLIHSFQLMRVTPTDTPLPCAVGRVNWTDLKDATLIGLPPDNLIQQFVESHLQKIDRGGEDKMAVNYLDTLISMVESGMGTAVVPSLALLACRRRNVQCDLLEAPAVSLGFYQISKSGRSEAAIVTQFTHILMSSLPSLMA